MKGDANEIMSYRLVKADEAFDLAEVAMGKKKLEFSSKQTVLYLLLFSNSFIC